MLPYQVSVGGQTYGPGSDVNLTSIKGLRDMPPLRTGNIARGGQDGMFPGFNFLDAKVITLNFNITRCFLGTPEQALQTVSTGFGNIPDPATVSTTCGRYLAGLQGASALSTSMMLIQLPNRVYPLVCFGRTTHYAIDIDHDYNYNVYNPVAEFTIDDGAVYDLNVSAVTIGLASATATAVGITFPLTFPAVFGAATGGAVALNNSGNYQTWPVSTITGPCANPTITNLATGARLSFAITLAATDTLTIDAFAGTATLNGSVLRNNTLVAGSTFFPVTPGLTSIGFSSTDVSYAAGTLTVAILPAYSSV